MYQFIFFNHYNVTKYISKPVSSYKENIFTPISVRGLLLLFVKFLNFGGTLTKLRMIMVI